jgi:hypothetical protein
MLKKLKIGSRVNLLIIVPLVALALLATGAYFALNRASLHGAETRRLLTAEEVRADISPPPASLQNGFSIAAELMVDIDRDGFTTGSQDSDGTPYQRLLLAEQDYNARMTYWKTAAVSGDIRNSLVIDANAVGAEFWAVVHTELAPAMTARQQYKSLAAIYHLNDVYDKERTLLNKTVTLADTEVAASETAADTFMSLVVKAVLATAGVMSLIALFLALRVRRSIVGPIRALTAKAQSVASTELPDAVRQIQTMSTGDEAAGVEPFEIDTDDELADLAHSFNLVQSAAVDLAVEQADARRIVAENLINVGRRNQGLLERTLGFITTLEQNERDPDALDSLFRLDHLTTRMRRQAQSLLVLAGAEPNRLWSAPLVIGDVIRVAQSQVEEYAKIELGEVGRTSIIGAAAPEVAHLLAELLENATMFSPPGNRVTVLGKKIGAGHQLAIVDYGIGMTEDELVEANNRLTDAKGFDRESSRTLGLQVVARLAARYGIKVRLVESAGGIGVTAIVVVPAALLSEGDSGSSRARLAPPTGQAMRVPAPEEMSMPRPAEAISADYVRSIVGETSGNFASASAAPHAVAPAMMMHEPVPITVAPTSTSSSGLAKRVRGAQLPDLGSAMLDHTDSKPTADEVRSRLSSLQTALDLGRQVTGQDRKGDQ